MANRSSRWDQQPDAMDQLDAHAPGFTVKSTMANGNTAAPTPPAAAVPLPQALSNPFSKKKRWTNVMTEEGGSMRMEEKKKKNSPSGIIAETCKAEEDEEE